MRRLAISGLKSLIRVYQLILSPLLGPGCRYHPSCSQYAIEALEEAGFFRGTWLAICRLGKCHPWGGSGYDPVSERQNHGS